MIRMTPIDIQQKQFSRRYKGYDTEEVKSFLEIVSEEMAEQFKDNTRMKEEVKQIQDQLKEYADMEAAMRDVLVETMVLIETQKTDSRQEAERLKAQADSKAEEMLRELQQKVIRIHEEISNLKYIRKHFKDEMKKLIASNLGRLNFHSGNK